MRRDRQKILLSKSDLPNKFKPFTQLFSVFCPNLARFLHCLETRYMAEKLGHSFCARSFSAIFLSALGQWTYQRGQVQVLSSFIRQTLCASSKFLFCYGNASLVIFNFGRFRLRMRGVCVYIHFQFAKGGDGRGKRNFLVVSHFIRLSRPTLVSKHWFRDLNNSSSQNS